MTTEELVKHLNNKFRLNGWPNYYKVDAVTYANACKAVIENRLENSIIEQTGNCYIIRIAIGPHNGVMFKGIELILEEK